MGRKPCQPQSTIWVSIDPMDEPMTGRCYCVTWLTVMGQKVGGPAPNGKGGLATILDKMRVDVEEYPWGIILDGTTQPEPPRAVYFGKGDPLRLCVYNPHDFRVNVFAVVGARLRDHNDPVS